MNRKQIKKIGKHNLKTHYWIFIAALLIASLIGADYAASSLPIEFSSMPNVEQYSDDNNMMTVINDLIDGKVSEAQSKTESIESSQEQNSVNISGLELGYSRGIFATAAKLLTSGSIFLQIFKAISAFTGTHSVTTVFFFVLSVLLTFLVWMFIKNNYKVTYHRIFMEGQKYEKVSVNRFAFLFYVRKFLKPALTILLMTVYQALWWFTIVGGIIKTFSYFLVPYIVAENPDIAPNKAITLSRKMMKGHKWELFVFMLSFIGWNILGFLSCGILNIFFLNAYKECSYCGYYEHLRQLAKQNNIENSDLLNDTYLFEKADNSLIIFNYKDVFDLTHSPEPQPVKRNAFLGFLANVFGIIMSYDKTEKQYSQNEERRLKIKSFKSILDGAMYPHRLCPLARKEHNKAVEHVHYLRHYSIGSLIMMFFIFSFIGWLWEVCLFYINTGEFVNRGVLHGPWLPIYGSGGLIILILLNKLRSRPVLEFVSAVVLCGFIEYFTALALEMTHGGQKWWDYSGYFLNFNGRISAEGLLVFGIGGMAVVYFLAPALDNLLRKISLKVVIPVCAVLLIAFAADQVYSASNPNTGKGITDNDQYQSATYSQTTTVPQTTDV